MRPLHTCLCVAVFALAFMSIGVAQDAPAPDKPASPAAGSADDVLQEMLKQRQDNPLIEPTQKPAQGTAPAVPPIDPAVLGVAPGGPAPKLRREGEFVTSRRGRIVRAPAGGHVLFVFEADGKESPETPMILMPCQMLQNMEDLVAERGDKIVFVLSGQVFTYRGANYLLPTMMKLSIDRGNLQN